jgi:hypothetical protein
MSHVLLRLSEPTPKTCTGSSGVLDKKIDNASYKQQRQTHVYKHPKNYPQGQVRFFQTMPHHGFVLFALAVGFEHTEILKA